MTAPIILNWTSSLKVPDRADLQNELLFLRRRRQRMQICQIALVYI